MLNNKNSLKIMKQFLKPNEKRISYTKEVLKAVCNWNDLVFNDMEGVDASSRYSKCICIICWSTMLCQIFQLYEGLLFMEPWAVGEKN